MIGTERFIYKKWAGITVLSASFTDFAYKKHCHEEYAFGVTLAGVQKYYLAGSLELSYPHGVMLFNPEQVHDGMARDKGGLTYVMLYIPPAVFLDFTGQKEIVRFSAPIVYDRQLEQTILNLATAILSSADDASCSDLLVSFAERIQQAAPAAPSRSEDAPVSRAKEMICSSLDKVLRLDDLCQELAISKFKLIRMFKANTGLSPYQYFLNCKLARARQIIEQDKDVYSAVTGCGFVDLTHMNRHFKSIYGTTAFEYSLLN